MLREATVAFGLALVCQVCLLVTGEGSSAEGNTAPWRITPRIRPVVGELTSGTDTEQSPRPVVERAPEVALHPTPLKAKDLYEQQEPIKGIYATGYTAGSKRFDRLLELIRSTELNALVVDVKDDTGVISYSSLVPLAVTVGAGGRKFSADKVIAALNNEGIYSIARIAAFKDPLLAAKRPDLAIRSKSGGSWRDDSGHCWVDPHSRTVWKYLIDLAKEAAGKGFREIQFDYVRFPSDGKLSDCVYPFADGRSKAGTITDFLLFARRELKPLGVTLAADVYGITCTAEGDLGIGQIIQEIATAVDVVSPMVYPSHYYRGTYGIPEPEAAPYETVLTSLSSAVKRLSGMGVVLRPWLQDFSLRRTYGRPQLLAQKKAVYDAELTEWIFWNPSNVYNTANYLTEPSGS